MTLDNYFKNDSENEKLTDNELIQKYNIDIKYYKQEYQENLKWFKEDNDTKKAIEKAQRWSKQHIASDLRDKTDLKLLRLNQLKKYIYKKIYEE